MISGLNQVKKHDKGFTTTKYHGDKEFELL